MKDFYKQNIPHALLFSKEQMDNLASKAIPGYKKFLIDYSDGAIDWFTNDDDDIELDTIYDLLAEELGVKSVCWAGVTFDEDIIVVFEDNPVTPTVDAQTTTSLEKDHFADISKMAGKENKK